MKLAERAMLVSLSIGSYSGMMHDKVVTEETNASFKADRTKAGKYNKRLVASHFLSEVRNAHENARKIHRLLTLPWEDDGTRILPTRGYINYMDKMRGAKHKVEDAVKLFVKGLPEYITEAQVRLGDMFHVEDYPDEATLKDKFHFDVEVNSIPNAADFRAKLSDDQVKSIVKDIEKRCNKRLENAMNDVFERASELVEKMKERLRGFQPPTEGQKAKGIIRDSVVYDIFEFANMMETLNVTDDERIEGLRKQLLSDLVEPASPEILRTDTKARALAIKNADAILKKVKGYMT